MLHGYVCASDTYNTDMEIILIKKKANKHCFIGRHVESDSLMYRYSLTFKITFNF